MTVKKFTQELLLNIIKRDIAILNGTYPNINSKSLIHFTCKCGSEGKKSFCLLPDIGAFCRKCTLSNMAEKNKQVFIEKYGCENPFQNEQVKEKIKQTCLNKYGHTSPMKNKEVTDKLKNVFIEKYGCENPFQNQQIKEKIKESMMHNHGVEHALQKKEFRDKYKETMMERHGVEVPYHLNAFKTKGEETNIMKYGVAHPLQNNIIKEKIINTCITKYGVKNSLQNKEIRNKIVKTCKEKYGVENPFQSELCKEKIKATNIEKYGVENVSQNPSIFEKAQKNAHRFKQYKMLNGETRLVQGYEPFALDELFKIYTSEQIKTFRQDIPRIAYTYNNKNKFHFPDIYIPHENRIIEVKSTWTYKRDKDRIHAKEEATKKMGYIYEIWIYTNKGKRVEV